jgi:Trk K+ transport system NAD-binding subunit
VPVALQDTDAGHSGGHLIVCGDDSLAHQLVYELVTRYRRKVTVVLASRRHKHGPQIARMPGVRLVETERLDVEAFRQARIASADAVALVQQDDVGNIHAALRVEDSNPGVRIVIRMFNLSLGHGIRPLFRNCSVLSDAELAAPAFVAAALDEVAPVHVPLPDRALFVARRTEVAPDRIVCGLADLSGDRTVLLPSDPAAADVVLATADGRPRGYPQNPGRVRRWWLRRGHPLRVLRLLADRKLILAALALIALLIIGTGVFGVVRGLKWWDAAYLTVLSVLGGVNPDVAASTVEKIVQTVLAAVSIALIPVVTAAVVDSVINARLAIALGRLREPVADHVVVVGLGNVGTRVIRLLHQRGVDVVAIDRTETARGAQLAKELRVPVIIGDASREETLRAASVGTCRALLVLSTDDIVNLEAAINSRALNPGIRLVLRLFDGDFADLVQRAFRVDVSGSVSNLAAPVFAAAMLQRDVIGAIPVNRRVLLIAAIPVGAGSRVDGGTVATVDGLGGVRVIAVGTRWSPPADLRLVVDDRLTVVASRDGLSRLVRATSTD